MLMRGEGGGMVTATRLAFDILNYVDSRRRCDDSRSSKAHPSGRAGAEQNCRKRRGSWLPIRAQDTRGRCTTALAHSRRPQTSRIT